MILIRWRMFNMSTVGLTDRMQALPAHENPVTCATLETAGWPLSTPLPAITQEAQTAMPEKPIPDSTQAPAIFGRRRFLGAATSVSLAAALPLSARSQTTDVGRETTAVPVLPARLQPRDLVALVNPASARHTIIPTEIMAEAIEALGLRTQRGANYYARRGYMAGSDEERAADINAAFADPEVRAIWATGGWGSARTLPLLDFDLIRRNPKVLVGYSDATALLNAVHSQTGLVTFHGPFPQARVTADYQRSLLLDGKDATLRNPQEISADETVVTQHRIRTIRGGTARGRLIGGNLTVLSAIVGSGYLPDFDGAILFLEDVNEAVYRVDRMLTQLRLAGILDKISGFVFGNCTECDPSSSYGSLTLEEAIRDHVEPLGVPAWMGAMFGHIPEQFTLPIGVEASIDADSGTIAHGRAVA